MQLLFGRTAEYKDIISPKTLFRSQCPIYSSPTTMPIATTSIPASKYRSHYDPAKVLQHPEFQSLAEDAPELSDPTLNIACAYNPAHEIHMIKKPRFAPGPGEVAIHVRATGICGYVFPLSYQNAVSAIDV